MPKPNVREKLLTAGLETLHQKGFNATSVQDITEAAGVPKGSFYNHFESKEALGTEIVQRYVDLSEDRRRILEDKSIEPLPRLRRYFEALNQIGESNNFTYGCLFGNFATELSLQSPLIREQLAGVFAGWVASVARVIGEAQDAGTIPGDVAPDILAAFLIHAWEGAVLRSKIDQNDTALNHFLTVTFQKVLA